MFVNLIQLTHMFFNISDNYLYNILESHIYIFVKQVLKEKYLKHCEY